MKELKDTVDLMLSDDYVDRFKAEYYQLETRFIKLASMVGIMAMYLYYLIFRSGIEKVNIDKSENIDEIILVYM